MPAPSRCRRRQMPPARQAARTRPGMRRGLPSPADERRRLRSFSALLFRLSNLQVQRAGALRPVSRTILHELLQFDLAVVDADDDAEVLAHVVALTHLVDV